MSCMSTSCPVSVSRECSSRWIPRATISRCSKARFTTIQHISGLQSEISVRPLYHGMPHYLEALAVYEDAGFELFDLTVVTRTSEGGLQELNCFMKRARREVPSSPI